MPDVSPLRPSVLLLAGDVRGAWTAALAAGGLDIRTTGWLDGVTAARLHRPDLVLVSADLPAGAPQTICMAFRSADDLKAIPVAIAGLAPDVAERERELPTRADRYVPAPIDVAVLVREAHEALRAGRVPWRRRPVEYAIIGLLVLAFVAVSGRFVAGEALRWSGRGTGLDPTADAVLLAVGLAAFAAALVLAFTARRRPFTPSEWRSALGWAGFPLLQSHVVAGVEHPLPRIVGASLGFVAWAIWAWLAPRVKPRTPRARRAWHLLAASSLLVAAAPWIALAWMFARS